MSEHSLSVNAAVEPFAAGMIGVGMGYAMAPKKYSLKRLLILKPEVLSKIYSDDVVKQMSLKEKEALENILAARDEYKTSKRSNAEEVKRTAKVWYEKFITVDIPKNLQDSYKEARVSLQNAIAGEDYINLSRRFRQAKAALAKSPDNEGLRQALTTANAALASAHARIAAKIENYSNNVKNVYNERLYNVKNSHTKYIDVKEAYNNFLRALAKRRTIASNKLFELSNNKQLLSSYNTIKEFIPKARTKAALSGGLIFGAVSALFTSRFCPPAAKA